MLTATVAPSEDPARVLAAMRNVLGDCEYSVEETEGSITLLSGSGRCLQRIHDQLRDRHVRDAARRLMLSLRGADATISLMLNRQAAAAGVVALCTAATESPLGPLRLAITSDAPDSVVDWLTAH